jgi:hypothetical protein
VDNISTSDVVQIWAVHHALSTRLQRTKHIMSVLVMIPSTDAMQVGCMPSLRHWLLLATPHHCLLLLLPSNLLNGVNSIAKVCIAVVCQPATPMFPADSITHTSLTVGCIHTMCNLSACRGSIRQPREQLRNSCNPMHCRHSPQTP